MPLLPLIRSTFRTLTRGEDLERQLDEELQSTLEMLVDEKTRAGMDPGEARREALMELGGAEQVKLAVRESQHGAGLDAFVWDLRHAVRVMRKAPGFTVVVVLTLALGIGANTALFSTVNAALIRDIPFDEPDRLVAGEKTQDGVPQGSVSRPDYFDISDSARSFEGLAAYVPHQVTVTGEAPPEVVGMMFATWNLLPVLGADPIVGRHFLRDEEIEGGSGSALISEGLWQRRFGGDPDVVGGSIDVDGDSRTIVGVVPAEFRFMADVDLWIPIERGDFFIDRERDSHSLQIVGRLRPGVTLAQAQSEADAITAALEEQYPETNAGKGFVLYDLQRFMVGEARISLFLLMATTAMVLLIACGNVAGLLLARGQARLPEMAMRSALGAPRKRLVRQLVTESVLVTLVAGVAGIGLAVVFQKLLLQLLPLGRPGLPEPALDVTVLLFTLLVSILAGVSVGVVPALRATSFDPWDQLKTVSRVSEGRRSSRLRNLLVVAQVAISVVLLVGSGLLIQTMTRLTTVDLGFDPDNLLAGTVGIRGSVYETPEQRSTFFATLVERVEALPGVVHASTISKLPIASPTTDWLIWPADQPKPAYGEGRNALARFVTPGYFETMGIPLLMGRDIDITDTRSGARVIVLSEAVAEGLFPGRDPIGRMVNLDWNDPCEVVGVVGNARLDGVRSDFDWAMYMSSAQFGLTSQWLAVRTQGDPALFSEPIRTIVQDMDPDVVFSNPRTMSAIVEKDLSGFRTVTTSLGLLAGIALLLTAIGLYGVLAFHVNQRLGEFGIRIALGAPKAKLLSLVFGRSIRMIGAGLLLGVFASVFGARMVQGLLFRTDPLDPIAFLGATAFLGTVGLIACILPAWRAIQVNPVEVLRKE
ncbi:MAG: ABC transporter permease [Candidatus Sulfomarinibacteraceae bacterium]